MLLGSADSARIKAVRKHVGENLFYFLFSKYLILDSLANFVSIGTFFKIQICLTSFFYDFFKEKHLEHIWLV